MKRVLALCLALVGALATTVPSAHASNPLAPTSLTLAASVPMGPGDMHGTVAGPGALTGTLDLSGGHLYSEDCAVFGGTDYRFVLRTGAGDEVHGVTTGADGGGYDTDAESYVYLRATGGTGRFAGWTGTGVLAEAWTGLDCYGTAGTLTLSSR